MSGARGFDLETSGAVGERPARARVVVPPGAGPHPCVVLVHGYMVSSEWGFWPELAERLARIGIASARVTFSGDGVGADLRTIEDLAAVANATYVAELEDLRALRGRLDAMPGLGPFALVGHSRGGGMGAVHAAENGDYRAVVLWAAFDGVLRFSDERLRKWREQGWIDVVHYGLADGSARLADDAALRAPELVVDAARSRIRLDVSVLESALQHAARLDVLGACARLRCPVLVVHGARDRSLPLPVAERLRTASRGELVVIEDAGHVFGARDPLVAIPPRLERLLSLTTEWLGRHLFDRG